MTTPREALKEGLGLIIYDNRLGPNSPPIQIKQLPDVTIDAILTALAPYLRTPGTVERCQHYANASCGENEDHPNMGVCGSKKCPFKVVR